MIGARDVGLGLSEEPIWRLRTTGFDRRHRLMNDRDSVKQIFEAKTMKVSGYAAASFQSYIWVVAVVLLSSLVSLNTASAQLGTGLPGQMNLPRNDFIWTWGIGNSVGEGYHDFSIIGSEGGFRCELMGKLRVGSRLSRMDIMELERSIRDSMSFIQAATNAMYALEGRGELEWATLECARPEPVAEDQEKQDRRKERSLERLRRKAERARARREQEAERDDTQ
jgi:hypothetical protein